MTRERLQAQFIRIQQALKKTVIFVTHDLDEAIRLADRIAIMESGRLVQYDTPEAILSRPKNRFVRDFVGTDRALKRLSRINIKNFIRPAPAVNVNMPTGEAITAAGKYRWLWVVNDAQQLIGWADRDSLTGAVSIREVMNQRDSGEIARSGSATLREALSRMLGLGFKHIPVVDDEKRLIGELELSDVEAATTEGEE